MMTNQSLPSSSEPGFGKNRANSKGKLFIISAPSGTGKTTLCRRVLNHFTDMRYSVSHTTRAPRGAERDHIDYHFITRDEFEKGIQNDRWAEWAVVHGNYYGTSAQYLVQQMNRGRDILLDIDVQGTMQILKRFADSVTIFIMPPSLEALRNRLDRRGTEDGAVVEQRMKNAEIEMAQKEKYRHIIVNDQLEEAEKELISLIESYRRSYDNY
jgi:guanylate kinase